MKYLFTWFHCTWWDAEGRTPWMCACPHRRQTRRLPPFKVILGVVDMGDVKRHFEAFNPKISSHLENLFIVGEKFHLNKGWIAAARWDNEENHRRKPVMRKTTGDNKNHQGKPTLCRVIRETTRLFSKLCIIIFIQLWLKVVSPDKSFPMWRLDEINPKVGTKTLDCYSTSSRLLP